MQLTRSQFLRLCAGAGLGALGASVLAACGDSDGQGPADPPPDSPDAPRPVDASIDGPPADAPPMHSCQQPEVEIAFNHNHAMAISALDIAAGVEKEYDITGTSNHPHTVRITAAMFARLQQGMPVTVASSVDDGHPHNVTIRCA